MDREIDRPSSARTPETESSRTSQRPPVAARAERRTAEERTPHSRREKRSGARPRSEPEREGQTHVTPEQRETLGEIGRFRAVTKEDLQRYRYRGDDRKMARDLRALHAQGLARHHTIWNGEERNRISIFTLTKRGKAVLARAGGSDQQIYSGLVKPRELQHDVAIVRMYYAEARRIESTQGRIRRIVLDYELKQKVYAALARDPKLSPAERSQHQAEVARQNGLRVVNGKIPLPDLRIEYETAQGDLTHVDLELATEHYRGSQVSAKAQAGFKLYASSKAAPGLSAVLDRHDIMGEIFAL